MVGPTASRRAERFARLVELDAAHPGSLASRRGRRDPRTRQLLTVTRALRELPLDGGADPEFRERLRRRVVAVASVQPPTTTTPRPRAARPRLVLAEPALATPAAATPARAPLLRSHLDRLAGWPHPRLAFLAGALAALVLVTGVALVVSRTALPGQSLYTVKRGGEGLELALAANPQQRGMRRLLFAERRLGEVSALVQRDGTEAVPPTNDPDATLVVQTLQDMDSETQQGTALVAGYAVQHRDGTLLGELSDWAAAQQDRVASISEQSEPALASRADESAALLERIQLRVTALSADLGCGCQNGAGSDDLGPLPCTRCAPPSNSAPATSVGEQRARLDTSAATTATPSASPSASGDASASPQPPPSLTASGSETPMPTVPVPPLPPLPSVPDSGVPQELPTVMLPT